MYTISKSPRKLSTCVHAISHLKQIVYTLCTKMMCVHTVYQWSMHYLMSAGQVLGMQNPHLHFMLVGNLICLPFSVLQWNFSFSLQAFFQASFHLLVLYITSTHVGASKYSISRGMTQSSLYFASIHTQLASKVMVSSI